VKEYPNESAVLSRSVPIRGEAERNLWCTYVYVCACVRVCVRACARASGASVFYRGSLPLGDFFDECARPVT